MTTITSATTFQVKKGKSEQAREEIAKLRKQVEKRGGQMYINWIVAGAANPNSLVLFTIWPSAKAYAKVLDSDLYQELRFRGARGKSALNVTHQALLQLVDPDAA